ncbi:hypothetical protein EDB86DRAFT_3085229 [Lactarius hatsudake]|nr:hypothetical protein EDB86DRAFT_3085229 [Lactarius hatsudake]
MTPDIVDSGSYGLSNTMPSLSNPSGGGLSTCSPFASGYQQTFRNYGIGHELGTPPLTPTSLSFPSGCAMDDTHDIEMPVSDPIACQRRPKSRRKGSLSTILRDLQGLRLTAVDLLVAIIDGNGEFEGFRNALFSQKNRASLVGLLDRLIQDDKGKAIVEKWMSPHALRLVREKVHVEMEAAKPHLRMNTTDVSPEFIEHWDIHQIMEPLATPTLRSVLEAAGESKVSIAKPKSAKSKNRLTAFLIIMAQIHYLRSWNSARVQIGLGLQAWACGTSRQMIDVLHRTGLTVSYNSISSMVQSLAERSIERAKAASLLPHALAYDNINISSSIFVEQGPNAMSKVQSGTFAVIYELLNARAEDMGMEPLIDNLRRSSPLAISDLRMTLGARQSYISQTAVTIVRILTKHVIGFETQQSDPILQHPPRQPLPVGHKTVFHPLRVSTIEEASVDGNLLVHDDVYLVQLKRTSEDLDKTVVPSFNDQLTNARIRGGQRIRQKDVSNWERCEIFQLGFGSFHLTMNLLWCVLETHRGTLNQMGSLTHLFAVLEKTCLGGEHPDYHTLLAALTQILHGLILNAWRNECDYPSLRDFARAEPTPGDLLDCARRIVEKYASVEPVFQPINPKAPPKDLVSGAESTKPVVDVVHRNIALLTHDLLLVAELVDAIATGDFGRVEDILPTLACMFRGSGSNNYSMEILHLIFNIKEVWTPAFADIMRDNMLVNPSGLPGHAMGIDMNIEHLIRYLKTLFAAKGIYSNWDRLGNIAAGINYLQLVKKRVTNSLRSGYRGSTHTDVDTSALVWRIANKANELGLQSVITDRGANSDTRPVVDIFTTGFRKFQTSSLATFNKKLADTRRGSQSQSEVDEIAPCQVVEDGDTDEPELSEEISELHED